MDSRKIEKRVEINAPACKVWEVLTDTRSFSQWLSDGQVEVTTDWQIGSPITFHGKWHRTHYKDKGIVVAFTPCRDLQYTYLSRLSRLKDVPENYSLIEFKLVEESGRTTLTFIQSNFPGLASYEHSNFYWSGTLQILKKLIESGGSSTNFQRTFAEQP